GEDCDGMGESAMCDADCTIVMCGDGVVNTAAGEGCDDGNTIDTDGCSNACIPNSNYPSTGVDGVFAPMSNTVLPTGVYNYTTITIPAGVTVTSNGAGLLDLRATGDVVIAGTLDVSGAAGGASGNGGCYLGGGGGGATGNVSASGAVGSALCTASA